jgi:hypothetical protein
LPSFLGDFPDALGWVFLEVALGTCSKGSVLHCR